MELYGKPDFTFAYGLCIQFLRRHAEHVLHSHAVKRCSIKPNTLLRPKNFIFILNIKITQRTSSIYNTLPSLHRELNFSIKTFVLMKHETAKISM